MRYQLEKVGHGCDAFAGNPENWVDIVCPNEKYDIMITDENGDVRFKGSAFDRIEKIMEAVNEADDNHLGGDVLIALGDTMPELSLKEALAVLDVRRRMIYPKTAFTGLYLEDYEILDAVAEALGLELKCITLWGNTDSEWATLYYIANHYDNISDLAKIIECHFFNKLTEYILHDYLDEQSVFVPDCIGDELWEIEEYLDIDGLEWYKPEGYTIDEIKGKDALCTALEFIIEKMKSTSMWGESEMTAEDFFDYAKDFGFCFDNCGNYIEE